MPEKFEIRFSVVAEPGSLEFELLSYLKDPSRTLYPLKDMTMIALTGVWLPLAYRSKQATPQQLHQIICDCTHRLMLQVQYFREMEELEARFEIEPALTLQAERSPQPKAEQKQEVPESEYDPEDLFTAN